MSREIKFRAWDYMQGRYLRRITNITYDLVGQFHHIDGEKINRSDTTLLYDDVELEQYTGLKDKNGKEIYEGDIVEWVNGLGEKHIFEILWNECKASFQMVEIGQEYPYILQGLSDKMKPYCEVIGNIHEDKEKLDGSN